MGIAEGLIDGRYAGGAVHLIGVSSLEIADVAVFLGERGGLSLVGHDLSTTDRLPESFRAAHIGMPKADREAHWERLSALDLPLHLGERYLSGVEEADVVIVSQAWRLYPANAGLHQLSGEKAFVTPMEIYLEVARRAGLRTVGVTGSNGKSTTTNMIAAMLASAAHEHVLAGNYRYRGPILETLQALDEGAVLLLEISNHHLLALESTTDIAVVTNVTENHLEEHDGFDDYIAVKRKLVAGQSGDGVAILNADDPVVTAFASAAPGAVRWFTTGEREADAYLEGGTLWFDRPGGEEAIVAEASLLVPGEHNVQNALAASLAADSLGIESVSIGRALASFSGVTGRLELVRSVADIDFFYDVESTTPVSTVKGVEAFGERELHLIAGGDNKGLAYAPLADAIGAAGASLYLLPGSASDLLRAACVERGIAPREHDSLDAAVADAYKRASRGAVVLLSPAAKAFYNHFIRGRASFNRLVKRLRAAEKG